MCLAWGKGKGKGKGKGEQRRGARGVKVARAARAIRVTSPFTGHAIGGAIGLTNATVCEHYVVLEYVTRRPTQASWVVIATTLFSAKSFLRGGMAGAHEM